MSDLVEKVAKVICESEDGGVWEQHRWDAGSYWHNEYERMARASIAVVLEEAAKVVERSEMFCRDEKKLQRQIAIAIRAQAKEAGE